MITKLPVKAVSHLLFTDVSETVRAFRERTMSSSKYFKITLLQTILMLLTIFDIKD